MSNRVKDLNGKVFGRLTVQSYVGTNKDNRAVWLCRCSCGVERKITSGCLTAGTKSCGCLARDVSSFTHKKHGLWESRIYRIWASMRQRCKNKNAANYSAYGGRGVNICEKWGTFEGFFEDMGKAYKDGLSIDRIDNYKGYDITNCRWVTQKAQANNRRNNRMITHNGVTLTFTQHANKAGISKEALYARIDKLGWTIHEALTRPVEKRVSRKL